MALAVRGPDQIQTSSKQRFPYFILLYLILFYFGSEHVVLDAKKEFPWS